MPDDNENILTFERSIRRLKFSGKLGLQGKDGEE